MFRIAVITLVAGVVYDQYFFDGYYIHVVEALVRSMMHHMIG